MPDLYVVFLDHDTKRAHVHFYDGETTYIVSDKGPYIRGEYSAPEVPNMLRMVEQGIDQEFRMLEAYEEITSKIELEEIA